MIISQKNKISAFLTEWLILIICFGFPIQSTIPVLLKIESAQINFSFRVVFLLASICLIWKASFRRPIMISKSLLIFLMFMLIYSYRVISDVSFKGKTYLDTDSFFVYSFLFGATLIPSIAIFLSTRYINFQRLTKNLFIVLLISNICVISNVLFFSTDGLTGLFLSRGNVLEEINGETISKINGITVSFIGQQLCLVSLTFLLFNPFNLAANRKILLRFALLLGFTNLILGASRGPLLFFFFLLFFIIFYYFRYKNYSSIIFLKITTLITIIVFASRFIIGSLINESNSLILYKMINLFAVKQSRDLEARDYLWASAWRQFKENPIFGDSFVTDYMNSYSHNLFLDSLMATGVVGTILLFILLFKIIESFWQNTKRLKVHYLPIWIVFFSIFLLSMTSGSLFLSFEFWIMLAVCLKTRRIY